MAGVMTGHAEAARVVPVLAARPRRVPVLGVVFVALVLSACQSRVGVDFVVSEEPAVSASVAVSLDRVAAAAFSEADVAALTAVLVRRGASEVTARSTPSGLTVSGVLPYSALQGAGTLTGVGDARLELVEGRAAVLTVTLVDPVELRRALEEAAAGQEDAEALAAAMVALTEVAVSVTFPGPPLQVVAPPGVAPALEDRTIVVVQNVEAFVPGELTVAGSLEPVPGGRRLWWALVPLTAAAGLVAGFWRRKVRS
jgi:hypothetical protein